MVKAKTDDLIHLMSVQKNPERKTNFDELKRYRKRYGETED